MEKFIKIHPMDNVAVALIPLPAKTTVSINGQEILLLEDIPQGHKFALSDLGSGDPVIKYGHPIGLTKESVRTGSWIHVHNMKTALGDLLTYTYNRQATPFLPPKDGSFKDIKEKTDGLAYEMKSGSFPQ